MRLRSNFAHNNWDPKRISNEPIKKWNNFPYCYITESISEGMSYFFVTLRHGEHWKIIRTAALRIRYSRFQNRSGLPRKTCDIYIAQQLLYCQYDDPYHKYILIPYIYKNQLKHYRDHLKDRRKAQKVHCGNITGWKQRKEYEEKQKIERSAWEQTAKQTVSQEEETKKGE